MTQKIGYVGRGDEHVSLSDWNPNWPIQAQNAIIELSNTLALKGRLEHFGSTSAEGS